MPSGPVAAAEGFLEAQALLAAEQRAPKSMEAIDGSFLGVLGPSNTRLRRSAPCSRQRGLWNRVLLTGANSPATRGA